MITAEVFLLLSVWALFAYIHIRSSRWTGMGQAKRLLDLERSYEALSRNVSRMERDFGQVNRDLQDSMDEILKEVRAITFNGARQEIDERLEVLSGQVERLEQAVESIPCFIDRDVHARLMDAVKQEKP